MGATALTSQNLAKSEKCAGDKWKRTEDSGGSESRGGAEWKQREKGDLGGKWGK